jgi:hypothetical protein
VSVHRYGKEKEAYVPKMMWEQAVNLWRSGKKREAERLWNEEYERRWAAAEKETEEERGRIGSAHRAFMRWERLVCDICGKGPGQCSGFHPFGEDEEDEE